jgi:hemoglobin
MPSSDSLYDRLGGEATVTALIDTFYERIIADDDLRPFFEHSSMDTLRRMQREFIAAALGGPIVYAGRSIREAHAGRGITKKHLALFIEHLMESLKVHDISDQDSYDIISRLNKYADDVTGDTNVDG